ncbi:MAG: N-acetylneuraminate synthase family protein [Chloroflexi bacterium]|nr:N-acetylneuraminate synthase family protein [Chloroflexota bacterium]
MPQVRIGNYQVGDGAPVFVIAEIGINHNGSLDIARKLIKMAKDVGCNAVKFQKRTPALCVPPEVAKTLRETPWGLITYAEYRERIELGFDAYAEISRYCRELDFLWFASCWDIPSVDFMERLDPPCYKISSACLTNDDMLLHLRKTKKPLILSTGMSTMEEIRHAVNVVGTERLLIAHATSTYPCPTEELNLLMIQTLKREFDCPIGYSGHEVGLFASWAAVALGATFIERHITLDRAMWGSDQAASVEKSGMERLVQNIRDIEAALGDGVKQVYDSERNAMKRLRVSNNKQEKA